MDCAYWTGPCNHYNSTRPTTFSSVSSHSSLDTILGLSSMLSLPLSWGFEGQEHQQLLNNIQHIFCKRPSVWVCIILWFRIRHMLPWNERLFDRSLHLKSTIIAIWNRCLSPEELVMQKVTLQTLYDHHSQTQYESTKHKSIINLISWKSQTFCKLIYSYDSRVARLWITNV